MEPPNHPPQTRWGWFILLVVVALGAFELGWKLGRTGLEDENKLLRETSTSKFPELVVDLRKASEQAALDLSERRELQQQRRSNDELLTRTQRLESRVQALELANRKLTAKVATYEAKTFEVRKGESHQFAPGWSLGVTDVSTVYYTVDVQYGNQSMTMKPSSYFYIDAGANRFFVTLVKIEPATFQVSTRPIARRK